MSATLLLPSPQEIARALGGHVRQGGDIAFPGPGRKPADRSCTLRLDAKAPDGFVVADARRSLPDLQIKDHVRTLIGLEAFQPKHRNGNASGQRSERVHEVRDLSTKGSRNGGGGGSTASPNESGGRICLHHLNDILLSTTRRDLVDGLIPRVGLTVIYGPPKSGKSFFAFDLAACVAFGKEYRGRRVDQGAAIYCYLEGQSAASARVAALKQQYQRDDEQDVPFYMMTSPLNLVADHQELIAAIQNELGRTPRGGRAELEPNSSGTHAEVDPKVWKKPFSSAPHVIVIDTLNRSFPGSESSDQDMAAYIKALDAIRDAFECSIIVVHHCGHEAAARPRGHSSLIGAADAVIGVKKEPAGQFIAKLEMMKDGSEGAVLAGRLEAIDVGHDQDGELITSCVVVPVEAPTRKISSKLPKLCRSDATALKALRRACDEAGEPPPASGPIPHNTKVVTKDVWREYAFKCGVSGSDEDRAKRKAFSSAFERLIDSGRVGYEEPFAWLT